MKRRCVTTPTDQARHDARLTRGVRSVLAAAIVAGLLLQAPDLRAAPTALDAGPGASFDTTFLGSDMVGADLSRFSQGAALPPGDYELDVFVNRTLQGSQLVTLRAPDVASPAVPCLTAAMLKGWGIDLPVLAIETPADECVDVSGVIAEASVTLKPSTLELNLSVPQASMLKTPRGYVDPTLWDNGVTAATVNYSLSAFHQSSASSSASSAYLRLSSGLSLGSWRLRHEGTMSWSGRTGLQADSLNAYAVRELIPWRAELVVGQSSTQGTLFDAISFNGVQLRSDDRMLPDSQVGYAPVVRGVARTQAKLAIRQNGFVVYEASVAPGPFEINDMYPSGFGGDLEVTVTEADGTESRFTVPFASVPRLLRPGLQRYALTAGKLRATLDGPDLSFIEATYQRGLTNALTGFGGMQATPGDHYRSLLAGLAVNTGIGAFSADVTTSRARSMQGEVSNGHSVRATYNKNLAATGTNIAMAAYRHSSAGFLTLREAAQSYRPLPAAGAYVRLAQKNTVQLTINQTLPGKGGSVYVSGSSHDYWAATGNDTTYQMGYSNTWRNINYSVSASRTRDSVGRADQQFNLNASIPLGQNQTGHSRRLGINYLSSGNTSDARVDMSATAGDRNQISYNASVARGSEHDLTWSAGGGYRAPYANLSGSLSHTGSGDQQSASISGGLVIHGGGFTWAPTLSDTVGIVAAPGAQGARLTSSGQSTVDSRGYAVVTHLRPYRQNNITLDPTAADGLVELDGTTRHVAPRAGAVVLLQYTGATVHAKLIQLTRPDGTRVPYGADIVNATGAFIGTVAQSGIGYMKGGAPGDALLAQWSHDGSRHQCEFVVPAQAMGVDLSAIPASCTPVLPSLLNDLANPPIMAVENVL